jgi:hypothetical protein
MSRLVTLMLMSSLSLTIVASGRAAEVMKHGDQSLKDAVAAFNKKAAEDKVGAGQSALTEGEVIAAIRGWNRVRDKVDDHTYAVFKKIGDSKTLPKNAQLDFCTGWEFNGYDFTVWWIDLTVIGETKGYAGYTFRIRDRKINCQVSPRRGVDTSDKPQF